MLNINDITTLYLGIQGENGAKPITINVHDWLVQFPGGSVTIWHKRNGDSVPSATGAVFDDEAETVTWTPSSTDTYVDGEGLATIQLIVGNVIKKSRDVKTAVSPSVTLAGTPTGSGWQDYIEAVDSIRAAAVTAKEDAEEAADDAQDAQEAAETAQNLAEIAAGIAIAHAGQINFEIDENGHLIFSYTDEVPVPEEDEDNE